MEAMGYQSLLETYAERGRVTEATLRALNPRVRWPNPPIGTAIQIPYFPQPTKKRGAPRALADVLRVSLERREITAFDRKGNLIALFPCSIAAEKNKRPPPGEIQVATLIPQPRGTRLDRAHASHLRHPRHAVARADRARRVARLLPSLELERRAPPRALRHRHERGNRIAAREALPPDGEQFMPSFRALTRDFHVRFLGVLKSYAPRMRNDSSAAVTIISR